MGIKLMSESTTRNETEIFIVSKNFRIRYSLVTKRNIVNSTKEISRNHLSDDGTDTEYPDKMHREEQNFTSAAFLTKMNNLHLVMRKEHTNPS